jgi:hypothetical protein
MSKLSFTNSKTFDIWLPRLVVQAMQNETCSLVVVQDEEQRAVHYYVNGVEVSATEQLQPQTPTNEER